VDAFLSERPQWWNADTLRPSRLSPKITAPALIHVGAEDVTFAALLPQFGSKLVRIGH
jgi:hypothetical protein